MTLIGIPYFRGKKSAQFEAEVEKIYSGAFLLKAFRTLGVESYYDREEFTKFLKSIAVSYLSAKDMNSGRIQPNQQKKIFKKYQKSLEQTRALYKEVITHNSTSSNYHDAIRDEIKSTDIQGMDKMFDPYVTVGDGVNSLGSIATTLFDDFLGVLVTGAKKAPNYINENDKANMDKEYILWWLHRLGMNWNRFTEVNFGLGDWYTNEELNLSEDENPKKKGLYKSVSLDVAYDLLRAVDRKTTRADIETAMRKIVKN